MGRAGHGWSQRRKGWFKPGHTIRSDGWNRISSMSSSQTDNSKKASLTRLTHQQFDSAFTSNDNCIVPIADRVLRGNNQSSSSSAAGASGGTLRPLVNELSHVESILKQRKEKDEVTGYLDVHLPTCVKAVQDCIGDHKESFCS
jgi:hypothetical protein